MTAPDFANLLPVIREDLFSLGHNIKDWTDETTATVAIGGLSGKGTPVYRGRLRLYADRGFLEYQKRGRARYYRAQLALVSWAESYGENPYPFPLTD